MSLPMPWERKDHLEQRVSDQDREQVSEVLRVAAGDGRLSLEELDERLEACFAARTYGDLARVVADLPDGQAAVRLQARQPVPVRPKDVVHVKRVGGNVDYGGPWVVPKRMELEVRGGNVRLDFTGATVTEPVTEIAVHMRGGNLRLTIPEGYAVDANEVEFRGGSVTHRHGGGLSADVPIVHRITVTGRIVGGNVVVTPPKSPRRPGRLRRMLRRGE
jgi:Domain of unknown function (DUF1707)